MLELAGYRVWHDLDPLEGGDLLGCYEADEIALFGMLPLSALGASPLRGPGCRASHRAALRLDPEGLPSLAQRGQAGCTGGAGEGGPSPGPEIAGSLMAAPSMRLTSPSRTATT